MLDAFGNYLPIVAAGGNSRLARSARAKLQWRDRFGRWVEMGRGVKFKLRRGDGTVLSVTGTFVGAVDEKTGSIYVSGDSNGFKDGFYKVKSSNGQEIVATLGDDYLAEKGIELGKDVNGALVGDRADADIQDENDPSSYSEAPEGWNVLGRDEQNKANAFATDDSEFSATVSPEGNIKALQNRTNERDFKNWAELLDTVDKVDEGTSQWNDTSPENAPDKPQDAPETANTPTDAPAGGLDTDTFDVAREGFLVPTGKRGTTTDLPAFIEANKDFLGEGGKRLVINTDDNSVEIHNSADTLDNAKAQAGGIGVPDFIDLTTGNSVNTNDEAAPNPETPNGTDRSTDSLEPQAANPGPDQPVDQSGSQPSPAGDSAGGDAPADTTERDALGEPIPADRDGLTARAAYLDRATQRVGQDSPLFEKTFLAQEQINARLEALDGAPADEQDSTPEAPVAKTPEVPAPAPTPSPEPTAEPVEEAPAAPETPDAPADPEVDAPEAPEINDDLAKRVADAERDVKELELELKDTIREIGGGAGTVNSNSPFGQQIRELRGLLTDARSTLKSIQENREAPAPDSVERPESPSAPEPSVPEADAPAASRPFDDGEFAQYRNGQDVLRNVEVIRTRDDGRVVVQHTPARKNEPEQVVISPEKLFRRGEEQGRPKRPETPASDWAENPTRPTPEELEAAPTDAVVIQTRNRVELYKAADGRWYENDELNRTAKIGDLRTQAGLNRLKVVEPEKVEEPDESVEPVEPVNDTIGGPEDPEIMEQWRNEEQERRSDESEQIVDAPEPDAAPVAPDADDALVSRAEALVQRRLNAVSKIRQDYGSHDIPAGTPEGDNLSRALKRVEDARELLDNARRLRDDQISLDARQSELDDAQTPEASPQIQYGPEAVRDMNTPVDELDDTQSAREERRLQFELDQNALSPEDRTRLDDIRRHINDVEAERDRNRIRAAEPVAEVPEEESDELPNDIEELERLAGALERKIEGARPARQKVLKREVDAIYDKIDRLEGGEPVEETGPPEDVVTAPSPEAPDAPEAINAPAADRASVDRVNTILEGKEVASERRSALEVSLRDAPTEGQLADWELEILGAPNRPNTTTRPRPALNVSANRTTFNETFVQAERDPSKIIDPNAILSDVKRNHPGYTTLGNGDTVLQTRTMNGKKYDLVVRRTEREEFFAYVKETNLATGVARGKRMRRGNHSYKALLTQINSGKGILGENPEKWMKSRRVGVEKIPAGGELGNAPLKNFIDGTDIPRSSDELYNKLVNELAVMAQDPAITRRLMNIRAGDAGFGPAIVEQVRAAVGRQKLVEAMESAPNSDKPSHVSYDGTQLQSGDWVDWTDTNLTVNGVPNPNYGRVYRGQVRNLIYKTEGNEYVYSDVLNVTFRDMNIERGKKPSKQWTRVSSKLQKVDQGAPPSAPFYAKDEEAQRQQQIVEEPLTAKSFGVPAEGTKTVRRPNPPAKDAKEFDPVFVDGHAEHPDFSGVPVRSSDLANVKDFSEAEAVNLDRTEIAVGDFVVLKENGSADPFTVLEAADLGDTTVLFLATVKDGKFLERTLTLSGDARQQVWRKSAGPGEQFNPDNIASREEKTELLFNAAGKRLPVPLRERVEAAVVNPETTRQDVTDLLVELDNLRPARESPVKQVIAVFDMMKFDEDVAEVPGAENLAEAAARAEEDASALKRIERDKDDRYLGQPVMPMTVWMINEASDGGEFDLKNNVDPASLAVGDIIEDKSPLGVVRFMQVLSKRTRGDRTFLTVRNSLDNAWGNREGIDEWVGIGGVHKIKDRSISDISFFERDQIGLVHRPNLKVDSEYFRDPNEAPQGAVPRMLNDYDSLRVEDPALVRDAERNAQALAKSFEDGFVPEAQRMVTLGGNARMARGALHVSAAFGTGADGRELFTKVVESRDNYINEVLGMRVANILGETENYTGHTGWGNALNESGFEYRIIMARQTGDVGAAKNIQNRKLLTDLQKYDSAVRLGLLDILIGNSDRNEGNYIIPDGELRVVPIDNELADYSKYVGSEFSNALKGLIRSGNAPFTSAELLRYRNNLSGLRSLFSEVGRLEDYFNMLSNLDRVIDGVNGYGI